jgi:hypothetical protein
MGFPHDNSDSFIQSLLQERGRLYRGTARLREELKGYSDVITLKNSYEQTITDQGSTIQSQRQKIIILEQQVQQLLRKIWGKSSERYIAPDPLQRRIDFDGLDLLAEEAEAARQAETEVVEYKRLQVIVKEKKKPVRESLPEYLPRREEHIYPSGIDIHCGKWTELPPEITEIQEHEPASFHVRRIIRHKYVLKDKALETDTPIVTGALSELPLAKSYA